MKPIDQQGDMADPECGMALLLVLWFVLVMSMITAMTMSRESESTRHNLAYHDASTAQHMAAGGIYRALALLMEDDWQEQLPANGLAIDMDHNAGRIRIHIMRENRKLDPAMAPDDALSSSLATHPHVAQRIIKMRRQWLSTLKNNQRLSAKLPAVTSLSGVMSREEENELRSRLTVHTPAMSLQLGTFSKRAKSNRVGHNEADQKMIDGTFAIEAQVETANAVGIKYAVVRVYRDTKGAPQYHILEWN